MSENLHDSVFSKLLMQQSHRVQIQRAAIQRSSATSNEPA
jgi:hypothetical protein